MMKIGSPILFAVVLAGSFAGIGDAQIVASLDRNGTLSWNSETGQAYRVEWAPSPEGPWSRSWQTLGLIESHEATNLSVEAPIYYRVGQVSPPPPGMALVDAGPFQQGDNYTQYVGHLTYSNATPVHTVFVSAFYIERYEVSRHLWRRVRSWAVTNGYTDLCVGGLDSTNWHDHPVTSVSWYDAVKWCNARSEMEDLEPCYYLDADFTTVFRVGYTNPGYMGVHDSEWDIGADKVKWDANGYRLPTESEWEKAARGGLTGHHYPWPSLGGRDEDHIDYNKANYYYGDTDVKRPVGFYNGTQYITPSNQSVQVVSEIRDMANGYGLYDMAGNVSEWCWDWYDTQYYHYSPTNDPQGPPPNGDMRVTRNGNQLSGRGGLRCCSRSGAPPSQVNNYLLGFRCVRKR